MLLERGSRDAFGFGLNPYQQSWNRASAADKRNLIVDEIKKQEDVRCPKEFLRSHKAFVLS